MHNLLKRQLKRVGLTDEATLPDARTWPQLLERINRAYTQMEQDRYLLERSLGISSREMQEIQEQLNAERERLHRQNEYLNALHEMALGLISRLELTDLLEAIVVRAGALMGTLHGYIYLLEPGGTEMKLHVGIGAQAKHIGDRVKPGEGLAGKVWQTGQALVVDDYSAWPARLPGYDSSGLRAVVGMPLKSGSQVLGVIGLAYTDEAHEFGEDEIEILSRFAGLASIALDNARLYATVQQELSERKRTERQLEASYQREQERLKLSNTLREVAKIVSGTLDQQKVLDLIFAQLENVVTYHYATVTLLIGDELKLVARRGEGGSPSDTFAIPIDHYPLNAAALRDKRPLVVPDVRQDPRWRAGSATSAVRSFINAPLLVQDRPIGLLGVMRVDETSYVHEDAQIVFAFASQVAVALESARLYEYELAQVERELAIARQIQISLLPAEAPDIHGLDIAGFSEAARHAGGDFYNYFVFSQEFVGIAVGDVSGKGMQAALMMALSFGLLTNQVRREVTPAALLVEMNHEIHPHTQRNNLNTALCYVTLECLTPQPPAYPEHAVAKDGVKSSRLAGACSGGSAWEARIANAGLISPLVRDVAGTVKWADVKGFPLGMDKAFEYKELEYRLTPGSALILSSDGIVEAKNMAGEMYGFDRLARCIEAEPGDRRDAQALLEWILEDVRAFEGEAERHDDLTVVVVTVG